MKRSVALTAVLLLSVRLTFAQNCTPGIAWNDLDVNGVAARVYNTGALFFSKTEDGRYEVPQGSGLSPITNASIWIGGEVAGDVRVAASTYVQGGSDFELFPGPLSTAGFPPQDCSAYDRIYRISKADIDALNASGQTTSDLRDWPWQIGAPVVDGDGNPGNYDLEAGDRPRLWGDQMTWTVMHDAGVHATTDSDPIGLEVQSTSFATDQPGSLGTTTFYRYRLTYRPKTDTPLENAWFGIWADTDLGYFGDDYIGSDSTLGLAYTYNGDELDEGTSGYGQNPPAIGFKLLQGPVGENGEHLSLASVSTVYGTNDVRGAPVSALEFYRRLQGLWKDGSPMTESPDLFTGERTTGFLFSGNPPSYWTEDNVDRDAFRNQPGDRRIVFSVGPFRMMPGSTQEIAFAVIWSRGGDRLGSVAALKADAIEVQEAFDSGLETNTQKTGIEEPVERKLAVYPNPATSGNFVQVSGLSGTGTITLYDLNGTRISRRDYVDGPFTLLLQREDGSRLSSGVYFIHVQSPGKSYPVLKLAVISE